MKASEVLLLVKEGMYPANDLEYICYGIANLTWKGVIDSNTRDKVQWIIYHELYPWKSLSGWMRNQPIRSKYSCHMYSDALRSDEYIILRNQWIDELVTKLQQQGD